MAKQKRLLSDSLVQRNAEEQILALLNLKLSLSLKAQRLNLDNCSFEPDGFSDNPPTICEISAHIGKLKPAQVSKIGKDILKMLLIEKMYDRPFKKIVVFADEEASRSYKSTKSWYAQLQHYFNISIETFSISPELKQLLLMT